MRNQQTIPKTKIIPRKALKYMPNHELRERKVLVPGKGKIVDIKLETCCLPSKSLTL